MSATGASKKGTVLGEILALARAQFSATDPEPVLRFLQAYFRSVPEDDLLSRPAADLCAAALGHRQFGASRTSGRSLVRVFRPDPHAHGWFSPHTVVELVNDDRPFLLDSTLAALQRLGLIVDLTLHPILSVERDSEGRLRDVAEGAAGSAEGQPESFIHVEVSHPPEAVELEHVREELESVMADVRIAVEQWQPMRSEALSLCRGMEAVPGVEPSGLREVMAFLDWVADDHFTFVGFGTYDLVTVDGKRQLQLDADSALGVLRRAESRITRAERILPHGLGGRAADGALLVLTKANSRSTVHRASYLDSIGVKRFDGQGRVVGESRLLGLYTAGAYHRSPRGIPLLRGKVERVMRASGLRAASHGGRMLVNILDTLPRDELFQSSDGELLEIATGILNLHQRQRTRLFLRRDPYGRFYSCLVFVPRDHYQREVRERVEALLQHQLDGQDAESTVQVGDSPLARLHVIVRCRDPQAPSIDVGALEARVIEVVRSWQDELWEALVRRHGEEQAIPLYRRYGRAFHAAYREDFTASEALEDIRRAEALRASGTLQMHLYRSRTGDGERLGLKLLQSGEQLYLSDVLPVLENMGLRVLSEHPYEIRLPGDGGTGLIWLHDFTLQTAAPVDVNRMGPLFEAALARIWSGQVENDGFNRLTLLAGLDWREVSVLRMYCRYLLQTGVSFSQSYMEQTLAEHAPVAAQLAQLFTRRFDPAAVANRERESLALAQALDDALDKVASADHDRILRGFLDVVRATVRTNYFQRGQDGGTKPAIAIKLDPEAIPHLPEPRPRHEIFVYSPAVEAVHLRGGKVARGGIRWSDRREDFRTEVLGLMKAQMVKNTVIVPVGAKGGFVCKQLPDTDDREAVQREVIACYRTFIRSMLDVTDNYVGEECLSPPDVVRLDDDDPYLVVAADKGTASFSDIANEIAHEYGFWLGDAFASGGSSGYDHKGMAITARGAWESIRRHFREAGRDLDSEPLSVVGIGDMSGDVFGNGMLLSKRIRLIAAFNHRHIFIDPDPDPETAFDERLRLFRMPASAWTDYDSSRISAGGGVFWRSAKLVRLTPEIRKALDVEGEALPPDELIQAILRAPVDLLWNGGIGTYVKARQEPNLAVGDRANDNVRVNGRTLRCRMVGEGGNLGMTQLGRVEYALAGGRLNTDFIDNSAGVDCSDHEVNIKILLNAAMEDGALTLEERDRLLRDMTDEVTALVLRDNYLQTQAISMMAAGAAGQLDEHAYMIRRLEATAGLDRALEYLPGDEELSARRTRNLGLTRPELAVLLAYAKIGVYDALRESGVPEDPYLGHELELYFPEPLRARFRDWMHGHRLRREIIANGVTNSMVNRMGMAFAQRLEDELGVGAAAVARGYACAREILDARGIWSAVEALDGRVDPAVQVAMMNAVAALIEHATRWFLERPQAAEDVAAAVDRYADGVAELARGWPELVPESDAAEWLAVVSRYEESGVPAELARRIGGLEALFPALDIVALARESGFPVRGVAILYFRLAGELGLDWLVEKVEELPASDHWRGRARNGLREDLYGEYARLVRSALQTAPRDRPLIDGHLEGWTRANRGALERFRRLLGEIRAAGQMEPAALAVGVRELRRLAGGAVAVPGSS